MADPFKDIVPSIMLTKENVLLTEQDEKQYPSFIVNRALSYHADTVLIANEMNMFPDLDNKMKYDFLLSIVRARKRPFVPWPKKVSSEDLEAIKEYYDYSYDKALAIVPLLSKDQIDHIRQEVFKG